MMTSAVATIIQATSPLLGTGADAADDAADAEASAPDAAAAADEAVAAGADTATAPEAASDAALCASALPPANRASSPNAKARSSLFMVLLLRASEGVLAGLAGPARSATGR